MGKYKKVRGMHDLLPSETEKWQFVEGILTEVVKLYGYKEIRVPVIEEQSLFERSIGSSTDIIAKEIYAFQDRKGRNLALRPEGTASVVRAFIESEMPSTRKITRLYYYGQMFRYDRPQKNRYRQFNQFGIELLGGADPFFDSEVIEILHIMAKKLDISEHFFSINTLGCQQCKIRYTEVIKNWMTERQDKLCSDCQARLKTAPLRILDCKNEQCRNVAKDAPGITEILCDECKAHFGYVKEYLNRADIPYKIQPNLVRGLDYYTRTVFEMYIGGEANAVAAGGRYDSLVGDLGGPDIPAVGFAIGMERLISFLKDETKKNPLSVYFICIGRKAKIKGAQIADSLRESGITTEIDYEERGLKALMKEADRSKAKWCIILGEQELEKNEIIIKNMLTGQQENISFDNYLDRVRKIITGKS
jgi:histidyl-tRNA synthetase